MMIEAPNQVTEEVTQSVDDQIHVVCCEDENLALCSWELPHKEFLPSDIQATCVVCRELDGTDFCPKRGNLSCSWCHIISERS